jgi:hypothetical protein
MAKLSKAQRKAHAEAEAILTKDRLTEDEKDFVFQNWHEGANFETGAAGAFFTPWDMAADFQIDTRSGRVIDLCAGIGILSYFIHHRSLWGGGRGADITCVEINPRYVEIGRKLLPEARWINADVFDWRELDLGHYDCAIGNPPFGRVKRQGNGPRYRGQDFELHVIDIASELADYGAFIVPQQSASFRYSGTQLYQRLEKGRGVDFEHQTGLEMMGGAGIDTAFYQDKWKDVAPLCEIVCIEFAECRERMKAERDRIAARPMPQIMRQAEQLALL